MACLPALIILFGLTRGESKGGGEEAVMMGGHCQLYVFRCAQESGWGGGEGKKRGEKRREQKKVGEHDK